MIGYSQNFGLNWSLNESSIVDGGTQGNNQNAVEFDDIALNMFPDWVVHVNLRSNATRRSTNKSLKKVSADRHEQLIREEEERKRKEDELEIQRRIGENIGNLSSSKSRYHSEEIESNHNPIAKTESDL